MEGKAEEKVPQWKETSGEGARRKRERAAPARGSAEPGSAASPGRSWEQPWASSERQRSGPDTQKLLRGSASAGGPCQPHEPPVPLCGRRGPGRGSAAERGGGHTVEGLQALKPASEEERRTGTGTAGCPHGSAQPGDAELGACRALDRSWWCPR